MSVSTISAAKMKYLHGLAVDDLDNAFQADEMPTGEAFVMALTDAVNTYCGLSDHAGPAIADFVERLPYEGSFEHQDALLGVLILTETRRALDQLLEADEEFRQALIGDGATDDDTDRAVRDEAREHDLEHGRDRRDHVDRQLGAAGAAEDAAIRSSFYDGRSAEERDAAVGKSARGQLDGLGKVEVYSFDAPETTDQVDAVSAPAVEASSSVRSASSGPAAPADSDSASGIPAKQAEAKPAEPPPDPDPAMRLFGERPRIMRIDVPDFQGADPILVFRQATRWLVANIIAVAAGSRRSDSFPRIAPY